MKDTISFRFNLIAVVVVTVILAGFGFYNHHSTSKRLYAQLDKQSNLLLGRLQLSLPITMWNFEMEQLRRIIESEAQADFVGGIYVSDGKKDVIGVQPNGEGQLESSTRPAKQENTKERELTYTDGESESTVGSVTLIIDESAVEATLTSSMVRQIVQTLVLDLIIFILLSQLVRGIVTAPIKEVVNALQDIAEGEGDLTQRIKNRGGEIGELAENFNLFVAKIQVLVVQVKSNMDEMTASVNSMAEIASRTNKGVNQQRTETEQVGVAMNEMSLASQEVAANALEAADNAQRVDDGVTVTKATLSDTVNSIRKLAEDIDHASTVINNLKGDVGNIVSVLDVIRGIAEQTNLLALNAAIEAARAGEQGRGFAVVADEVRTLASRTQESTQEIQQMIERLQSGAQEAVDVIEVGKSAGEKTVVKANNAETELDEVTRAISTINDMNTQIAAAVEEQTAVTEDINRSLTRIVDIAEHTAQDTDATSKASQHLINLSQDLRSQVNRFQV